MSNAFAAVLDAVKAVHAGDQEALRIALCAAPADAVFRKAVAHRCAGAIFTAMAHYHIQDTSMLPLWRMLQGYAGNCALWSQRNRRQVDALVEALAQDGVPHVLLKGAARLRAGEPEAQWTHMDDIDILVPREHADDAASSLQSHGYQFDCDVRTQEEYRRVHHHLAPLVPQHGGKPVELHVYLEYPPWFSTRTDFGSLAEHLLADAAARSSFRLDAYGRALHALIHAVGLYRLGDVAILAAELHRAPSLLQPLHVWIANERKQSIGLRAVLVLAARIAQVPIRSDPRIERHLEWVMWREDAPPVFRGRMQVLDAYFASAISQAIPGAELKGLTRSRRIAVGIGMALAATGYRALRAR